MTYTYLTSLPPCAKAPKAAVITCRKEKRRRVSVGGSEGAGGGGLAVRSSGAALEFGVMAGSRLGPSSSMFHALLSGA